MVNKKATTTKMSVSEQRNASHGPNGSHHDVYNFNPADATVLAAGNYGADAGVDALDNTVNWEVLLSANQLTALKQIAQTGPATCPAGMVGCHAGGSGSGSGSEGNTYTDIHGRTIKNCNGCKSVCQLEVDAHNSCTDHGYVHDSCTQHLSLAQAKGLWKKYSVVGELRPPPIWETQHHRAHLNTHGRNSGNPTVKGHSQK